MNHFAVSVEVKDQCVWRVRAGSKIQARGCDGMEKFSTLEKIESSYSPNKTRRLMEFCCEVRK